MKKILNYIGGELIEPASGKFLSNYNPATAEIYSLVPDSEEADVAQAVESAQRAYAEWSNLPAEIRYEKLIKIAELISKNLDLLAEAESNDTGKPKSLAKQLDIPRAASNFRFYATAIMHFGSESYETIGQAINYTLRQPIGVVGCISPWNLPLYLLTWKIAPA
ncbi:MAG: aldehyde dehydrogenase family protein, partial [Acidobacteria bacterium]